MKEKNVSVFNADVNANKGYLYSNTTKLSCRLSNCRTSEAIWKMIGNIKNKKIIDIGCGDGSFTQQLLSMEPLSILGIDASDAAIEIANQKNLDNQNIRFEVMDIYDLPPNKYYDIAIVRGMLHHLYDVEKAIAAISKVAREVVVVEPNGFNPILKIIEKISPYHIAHEEKSYKPTNLDNWFKNNGGTISHSTYIGLVPMFCPDFLAKVCKFLEPLVERLPLIRKVACGQYVQKILFAEK